jgi:uncharacterized protein YbcI
MTSPGKTLKGGALNAAIANAVVGLLGDYVGKGPTKARAIQNGNIVLCVLEDTMTKAERSLVADGKKDFVLGMRHAFQETMQEDLTAAVEAFTGRKVIAFMSANHVDPDFAAELFMLDGPVAEGVEVVSRDSFNAQERQTATAESDGGLRRDSEHSAGITGGRDAPEAQARHGAERWLDDGGGFSSGAVARSKL